MPTKSTDKKTPPAKKAEAPAKGKKDTKKGLDLDESGGGDRKNATGT